VAEKPSHNLNNLLLTDKIDQFRFKHTEKIFSRPSPQKNIAGTPGNTRINISPPGSSKDIFNSWPEEFRIEFRKTCTAEMTELGYQLPE